jgi:predicted ester cyclase
MARVALSVRRLSSLLLAGLWPVMSPAMDVKIDEMQVYQPGKTAESGAVADAAVAFYNFWNSGEESYLNRAIAKTFTDQTLPPGRPQGPEGPLFASRQFRAAVPDLSVEVRKMIVAGEYVTVHMVFRGHFTGALGAVHGTGQSISFIATDLLRVHNGRITDNWHIEDNLTLMRQMGAIKVDP